MEDNLCQSTRTDIITLKEGLLPAVQQVKQMEVLGALLSNDGNQREALDFRLIKAEHVFRKYQRILCGRGSHSESLRSLYERAWGW